MTKPLVSLIIPVYNEELHLLEFLKKIDSTDIGFPKELIIVDDCSSDASSSIIENFSFQSSYQFFRHQQNRGKGAALRKGFAMAKGQIIGVQDADFEYSVDEVRLLVEPIAKNLADVAYGSRFKKSGQQVHRTFHYLINRLLTLTSNIFSGLYLTDMETCYKFFKAEIIKNIDLKSDKFGFEPEVTAKIARLHLRVLEIPVSYYPRSYIEGKKISWKDGIAAFWHILYFNSLAKESSYFREGLPQGYIPQGRLWL
ncbi:MAG: glycosyltransferase family 2 protein [Pseudobacteriovorax sp.]|nr:glycosyltransferase family 2 protein [Pseudobacteriovorax sp.]